MLAQHLVIAGKSGVGKSTTAANLGAALAERGKRVLLVGYDQHRSSTATLRGRNELRALPGWEGEEAPLYACGYRGSLCIEAAGAAPAGEGAEGGILAHPLVAEHSPEYVIHDSAWVPGEVLRLPSGGVDVPRLVAVTSADKCALQVVNHLFSWLNTVAAADCRFAGVVASNLSGPLYEAIVSDFASHTRATILATVPRSIMVSVSDFYNQTLLESAPLSHISYAYRKLARNLLDEAEQRRPKHLDAESLQHWARNWGDIISELETGGVTGGLGI